MTAPAFPLVRLVAVDRLPEGGARPKIEATPEECAALAREFKIPAVHALTGEYRVKGTPRRMNVTGTVRGRVTQVCVVTLEPFETEIAEEVDVDFSEHLGPEPEGRDEADLDRPDEIVNGKIDLGALTAEFLALGLDPYPRKPGVAFDEPAAAPDETSPFAALGRMKPGS
ncbi:YceD family protein [Salinarimonas soli]|uniref:DUF177 domain-containing protein n=1 Tax=Salinarimonas soli TaxID=1638099 RepID=A0A5B2VI60_9HYPH|nr:DUF177 domain-containing protein [Salinarimonas soli]KAA2238019.1 DUF177 domain-containing protein [Salinarimonas soli]